MGGSCSKLSFIFIQIFIAIGIFLLFPFSTFAYITTCHNTALSCDMPDLKCYCPSTGQPFGEGYLGVYPTTCDYTWTNIDCGNPPGDTTVGSDWTCYYPSCTNMSYSGGATCNRNTEVADNNCSA